MKKNHLVETTFSLENNFLYACNTIKVDLLYDIDSFLRCRKMGTRQIIIFYTREYMGQLPGDRPAAERSYQPLPPCHQRHR